MRVRFALITALALLIAACGSNSGQDTTTTADASTTSTVAEASLFPVTIEHAFGSTTIETQPERIATVHWGNHDVPIALGVVPVGMQYNTYGDDNGDGILPWTYDALIALGVTDATMPALFDEVDGVDFAGVDAVTPDVVLAAYSGLSQEDYNGLSQEYPVVAYPRYAWGTNWRDMALINGKALGLESEAIALVAAVDALMEREMNARPGLRGLTFAYTWIDPADTSSVWIYSPVDARVQYLETLGFVSAPGVVEAVGDSGDFGISISAETIDILDDADILVAYGPPNLLEMLQADPLISQIPAVASGAVVIMPDNAAISAATSGPTVLSIPWAITDYLDMFAAAATRVGM